MEARRHHSVLRTSSRPVRIRPELKLKHLRRFMETYGQEAGFSLAQVAIRAGHDPAVAAKHYTGRVSATDRALAVAIEDLLAD